jgi:hypothetical protein
VCKEDEHREAHWEERRPHDVSWPALAYIVVQLRSLKRQAKTFSCLTYSSVVLIRIILRTGDSHYRDTKERHKKVATNAPG